jgi:hypothetical protein
MIQKTLHRKLKDWTTRPKLHVRTAEQLRCSGRVNSSFSTSGTRRITLLTPPAINEETIILIVLNLRKNT